LERICASSWTITKKRPHSLADFGEIRRGVPRFNLFFHLLFWCDLTATLLRDIN